MEEARETLRQQLENLDLAIAISEAVLRVDCAKRPADFSAVSPSDVMRDIALALADGKINESVVYLLARHSARELIELRRRMSENAQRPRQPRVDVDRIEKLGLPLKGRDAQEITSLVWKRMDGAVSQTTIRKHLRNAGIIPPGKKNGS